MRSCDPVTGEAAGSPAVSARRVVSLNLRAGPDAARTARRVVCRAFRDQVSDVVLADAQLLVSELVTNSVRHAGLAAHEAIRLRARCDEECAHVEVCDSGRSGRTPCRRDPDPGALEPGGLGLKLVDEMADRWGVSHSGRRTCVWFDLSCAGPGL
jgi:anti-sigma regulatory factor (Ser/Thr protein kinase)